ncbi:hypothetical protein RFI_15188 [Reticulomyxa filosa]|uniref:Uncharacterized protein n=1 Tax=Reticulomyxa filosa TaxID=46433 RepID=X6N9N6_RETFI|nr:hypothetical protein RFI_15188 [Reticulomyxa filosa]|eukprot:ETO22012.1 hypothetical protein RFI_15188 [Reticulomyxa filosa]
MNIGNLLPKPVEVNSVESQSFVTGDKLVADEENDDHEKMTGTRDSVVLGTEETSDIDDRGMGLSQMNQESDENCKESSTLVAIIVIGLIVAGTVIGYLQLGKSKHVTYKGSHVDIQHINGEKLEWWQENVDRLSKGKNVSIKEQYIAQPIYRNDLLQSMYDVKPYHPVNVQSTFFHWVSVLYGLWTPTPAQLEYAFYNHSLVEREIRQEEAEHDEILFVQNATVDIDNT